MAYRFKSDLRYHATTLVIRTLSRFISSLLLCAGACAAPQSPAPAASAPTHVDAPQPPATVADVPAAPGPPPQAPDPWSGTLTWTGTTLDCSAVTGKATRSPSRAWDAFASGTRVALHAVTVSRSDPKAVWVVGDDGTILHSTDRGKNWSRCQLGVREPLIAIWSPAPGTAWILGAEHVFRLESGQATVLSEILDANWPLERGTILGGADESSVWIENRAVLMVSRDRGLSWTHPGACGVGIGDVSGTPAALWATCDFTVSRSTDGGNTWTATEWELHAEESLHVSAGVDDAWVVGQDSAEAGRTTDHGVTYVVEPLPRAAGKAFGIWSGGGGWAWVIADGLWVRRGKPGWVREFPASLVVRVGGADAHDIWAVGENGLVLRRR